ncbi:unnamed protein product [Rhodiola kirilowii]
MRPVSVCKTICWCCRCLRSKDKRRSPNRSPIPPIC